MKVDGKPMRTIWLATFGRGQNAEPGNTGPTLIRPSNATSMLIGP